MRNRRYADKVACHLPTEKFLPSVALFEVLKQYAPEEAAKITATKLVRSFFDEFLCLDEYNVQITRRLKWIERTQKYEFVPNFTQILTKIDNAEYLIDILPGNMLWFLSKLNREIADSKNMTIDKKRSLTNASNLLYERVKKYFKCEEVELNVPITYQKVLKHFKRTIKESKLKPKANTSIMNGIKLLEFRLKFLC
jgi:hypothetical protein